MEIAPGTIPSSGTHHATMWWCRPEYCKLWRRKQVWKVQRHRLVYGKFFTGFSSHEWPVKTEALLSTMYVVMQSRQSQMDHTSWFFLMGFMCMKIYPCSSVYRARILEASYKWQVLLCVWSWTLHASDVWSHFLVSLMHLVLMRSDSSRCNDTQDCHQHSKTAWEKTCPGGETPTCTHP